MFALRWKPLHQVDGLVIRLAIWGSNKADILAAREQHGSVTGRNVDWSVIALGRGRGAVISAAVNADLIEHESGEITIE
jgi:predicted aconitase with swiveling domain